MFARVESFLFSNFIIPKTSKDAKIPSPVDE